MGEHSLIESAKEEEAQEKQKNDNENKIWLVLDEIMSPVPQPRGVKIERLLCIVSF